MKGFCLFIFHSLSSSAALWNTSRGGWSRRKWPSAQRSWNTSWGRRRNRSRRRPIKREARRKRRSRTAPTKTMLWAQKNETASKQNSGRNLLVLLSLWQFITHPYGIFFTSKSCSFCSSPNLITPLWNSKYVCLIRDSRLTSFSLKKVF